MRSSVTRRKPRGSRKAPHRRVTPYFGSAALLIAILAPAGARAMCDVIPGVTREFRGALGSLNRPFAIPNDQREEIAIRLQPPSQESSS
jgi:hypothetical protein